ncbi:MAG: hypothetical protein MZV70_44890 [Desulfobacterales bacterium]|nr:hypothetical protein [Desulfobacterales bacterium]
MIWPAGAGRCCREQPPGHPVRGRPYRILPDLSPAIGIACHFDTTSAGGLPSTPRLSAPPATPCSVLRLPLGFTGTSPMRFPARSTFMTGMA